MIVQPMQRKLTISLKNQCIALGIGLAVVLGLITIQYEFRLKERAKGKLQFTVQSMTEMAVKQFPLLKFSEVNLVANQYFNDSEIEEIIVQRSGIKPYIQLQKNSGVASHRRLAKTQVVKHNGRSLGTVKVVLVDRQALQQKWIFRGQIIILYGAILAAFYLLLRNQNKKTREQRDYAQRNLQSIEQGNYSNAIEKTEDRELHSIRQSLTHLAHQFADQQDKLKVYASELSNKNVQISKQVNERVSAQQTALDTQFRLEAVFEQTFQITAILSLNGNILSLNEAALGLTGHKKDELLSQSFVDVYWRKFPKHTQQEFRQNFARALDGKLMRSEIEIENSNGQPVYILYSLKPVSDNEGHVQMVVFEGRDITERMRAELALKDTETQIRQSQKMEAIGRLAGGIAHDFNNLLTSILGFSKMAEEQIFKDHPALTDIREVIKAADKARALTQRLLSLSRKKIMHKQVLNINDVIEEIDKIIAVSLNEDIHYQKHLEIDLPNIIGDLTSMEQILVNMAVNASDSMPKGGEFTIRTQSLYLEESQVASYAGCSAGSYMRLDIEDTGCGMSKEVLDRAFDPFFSTKGDSGTGMGLATVYGIVQNLQGFITLKSTPGEGSQFAIYIPTTSQQRNYKEPSRITTEENQNWFGNETILVVEDEESVRKLTVKMIEDMGYHVVVAEDGVSALSLMEAKDFKIDLIVSDVVMPNMSGPELIHKLDHLGHSIPYIFVSGYTKDKLVIRGGDEKSILLRKPFTRDQLLTKVRELLDLQTRPKRTPSKPKK